MSEVNKKTKPFGFWPSGLSAEKVAGKALKFSELEALDGAIYWTESRPDDGGRNVIVKRGPDGKMHDMITAPYSASSKVHEYGGGEFGIGNGYIVFTNAKDQDLYRVDLSGNQKPKRLTNMPDMRFADIQIVDDIIIAVAELHDPKSSVNNMPENMLVRLALDADEVADVDIIIQSKLNAGRDFYSSPRISPCKTKITYIAWDLPFMPWDSAQLTLADLTKNGVENANIIAGGGDVAIFGPKWGNPKVDNSLADLYYISNETGIGNLYVYRDEKHENLLPIDAECGLPLWVFGMQTYDVLSNGHIVLRIIENGIYKLMLIDPLSNKAQMIDTAFRDIDKVTAIGDGIAAFVTTDHDAKMLVIFAPWASKFGIIRKSSTHDLAPKDISVGKMFKYPVGKDAFAWAIYYPPTNENFDAIAGELPPIIVKAHGGPTAIAGRGFNLKYQYWTNRGFGLVDLDYRGSWGYGRDYIKQLDTNWGITDIEDAVGAIEYLAEEGKIDATKAFITGGSAGGFTVLMALATTDCFLAGTSYYGVADLGALAEFTHKFELKYMDKLVGLPSGLNDEETAAFFLERSPLSKLDDYSSPTLFLQGMDDKMVLPEQSQIMYDALKAKGITTKLIMFEGEGHGFKRAENNITSLNEELKFYQDQF